MQVIQDRTLTYEQKVIGLAREAENSIDVLQMSDALKRLMSEQVICDLFEGNAPYRPRYIVPNYELFMKNGSAFLNLKPATNLEDALNNLMILYRHVPSITSFPVYIGNLDELLEPFITDEIQNLNAIKRFLTYIDRTITDSFCHANIGPKDTKAGRLILRAERELENSIPNLTMKVSLDTPNDFIEEGVKTALVTAKPSFANHEMFTEDLGEYGIVSCYNGLKLGGGSYTLVRMRLDHLAKQTDSIEEYLEKLLPFAAKEMLVYMDERIKFLVESSGYFEQSFLVKEGLIAKENFSAMFGLVGLAEAVNHFVGTEDQKTRFGHSEKANALGLQIIDRLHEIVNAHSNPHLMGSNEKYLLHAQVGIDSDLGTSPGCRIPIGDEPPVYDHVIQSAPFHQYFPSGIGDIFNFDETAKKNPGFIVDIIRGGFKNKLRYFSAYSTDCDVIRITGYLVKKSDIEKLQRGEQVLNDAVVLGKGTVENNGILNRKVRTEAK